MAFQIQGEYKAKNDRVAQYLTLVHALIPQFSKFEVAKVSRAVNKMANALANLASNAPYPYHTELNCDTLRPGGSLTNRQPTENL